MVGGRHVALGPNGQPLWLPDHAAATCVGCDAPFSFFRWRHHCRGCGYVFCSACTPHMLPYARYAFTDPVRLCEVCCS